jgi:hypothetical protein
MHIRMQNAEDLSPTQIGEFLKASEGIDFGGTSRAEAYGWIQQTLIEQEYGRQRKKERGVIRAYLSKVTGRSLAQITRLIRLYIQLGRIETTPYQRHRFATKYTQADVALLADVDRAHERMNGPATLRVLKREYEQFGKAEFVRLAGISVAHLYNLRGSAKYRKQAAVFERTRPTAVLIGERRKPNPQGRPGFLRVDTVHQGESATLQRDWDGAKALKRRACITSMR